METLIMDFTAISGKMEDLEIGNLIKQKEHDIHADITGKL